MTTQPQPIIRPFTEPDTDAAIALWEECELVRPWNDPHRDIERKQQVQPELFLVAELDHKLVGTAMVGYDGHRGWMNYLAVGHAWRRRGYARLLVERAEQLLLERGCPKLNLQVRDDNRAAIGFYESLGYTVDAVVSLGKRLLPD